MPTAGNLQVDCQCGQTLNVPVTVSGPAIGTTDASSVEPITATLHVDHDYLAAHFATHP